MRIIKAELCDLNEILNLQYLAYQSEAELFQNDDIPPLKQTLEEISAEFKTGIILKTLNESEKIIGSVRGYSEEETLFVGKLMVHPQYQGMGIGTRLLDSIERGYPQRRYECFTSSRSLQNLRFYKHQGYHPFKEKKISRDLTLIYLEKFNESGVAP